MWPEKYTDPHTVDYMLILYARLQKNNSQVQLGFPVEDNKNLNLSSESYAVLLHDACFRLGLEIQ